MQKAPTTKTCIHCGRTKPVDEFYKNWAAKDNMQSYCKECSHAIRKERAQKKKAEISDKSDINPLAQYTARELIAELRRRDYRGELKCEKIIKL